MTKKKVPVVKKNLSSAAEAIIVVGGIFEERGYRVSPANPIVLTGFFEPIVGKLYSVEVIGDEKNGGVVLQFATAHRFQDEEREKVKGITDAINADPKYRTGENRWLRIEPAASERLGGFRVCVVAKIEPDQGTRLSIEHCQEKLTDVVSATRYFQLCWELKS